jgi:hypothetical protein
MTVAVVCNYSVHMVGQEEHLIFRVVGVERPPVRECDNVAGGVAPVFVVDLCAIPGGKETYDLDVSLAGVYRFAVGKILLRQGTDRRRVSMKMGGLQQNLYTPSCYVKHIVKHKHLYV